MNRDEIAELFDGQAAGYDSQWSRLSAINECLYLLLGSVLAELNANANILCVGVGTGNEMIALAERFPEWHFTAVEPSREMIEECRQKVIDAGFADRCVFHHGFTDALPLGDNFDAATSFLVSQFILDEKLRIEFFNDIAIRLRPGGLLVNTDLSSDTNSVNYDSLLSVWFRVMSKANLDDDALKKMKEAYKSHVAVLPPAEVAAMIEEAGFDTPVQFFQAGMIHGWFARHK